MRSRHKRELDLVREYCKTLVGQQAKTKALVEEGKVTDRHFAEEDESIALQFAVQIGIAVSNSLARGASEKELQNS